MEIHSVKITQQDIDRILAKATPAQPAGFTGDVCETYAGIRPLIETAIGILKYLLPPAAIALATAVAILDKCCEPTR